jgi:hypothetical protein
VPLALLHIVYILHRISLIANLRVLPADTTGES